MKRWGWKSRHGGVAVGISVLVLAGLSACEEPARLNVAPPPAPQQTDESKPAYEYAHALRPVGPQRRPVVALLDPPDMVELSQVLSLTPPPEGGGPSESGEVEMEATRTGEPVLLPPPVRQFLLKELVQSREVVVVDRKRILDIIHELSLAKTKFFNPDAAPRTGYLVGVHYILEGLYWEPGALPAKDAIRSELEKRAASRRERFDARRQAVLYINAYEVETGQVKAVAYGADANPAVCARKAVEDLLAQFTDEEIYIKVTSVDPQTGTAILDIGSADDVKVGCLFAIETASEDGSPGEPVTAKVEQVDLLSCTCRLQGESKDAVQEGAPAHRAEPSGD